MKIILNLLAIFLMNLLFSQEDELNIAIDINSDEIIESIDFSNYRGNINFSFDEKTNLNFQNELTEEYFFEIKTKDSLLKERIWLDHGDFEIMIYLKSKSLNIQVIGSEIHSNYVGFINELQRLTSENATSDDITRFLLVELEKNINNPISYIIGLNILVKSQNNNEILALLMSKTNSQSKSLKSHYGSGLFFNTLESKLNNRKIDLANFTFLDSNNLDNKIFIENNDYILLDFWHTACPPCIRDHIELKNLMNNLSEKKTKVVSLSSDKGNRIETWKEYLNSKNLPWANYIEKGGNSLTKNLKIRIFPTYILLDKKYNIITYTNSLTDIKAELEIK